MDLIYQNFDGLDVSFQGAISETILNQMNEAKEIAQERRSPVVVYVGKNDMPIAVQETGAKGGYTYRFDTGLDGETWFVTHSDKINNWNIRVSVKSLTLALYGYEGVKQKILKTLEELQAYGTLLERISRFDYCFDFMTDSLVIDQKRFIAHSRCTRGFHSNLELNCVARGQNFESVRIGTMPNRQIAIYNKIKEITAKKKSYWWKIWGIEKKNFEKEIWRLEIRAGKKELNKWNLKRFDDFENKAGDVIISILNAIRYVKENQADTNVSRLENENFWNIAIKQTKEKLFNYISNADRKEIIEGFAIEIREIYRKQITGMVPAYMVSLGMDISEIPGVLDIIADDVMKQATYNQRDLQKKFARAEEKFAFLRGEENN